MKLKCPISGLTYQSEDNLPGCITQIHPLLSEFTSPSYLAETYLPLWAAEQLDDSQTHLLALAFLMKLPLVSVPILPHASIAAFLPFWNKHMEKLAKIACKLEDKSFTQLPKLRITPDSLQFLSNQIDDLWTETNILFNPISEKARKLNKASYKSAFLDSMEAAPQIGIYDKDEINSIILRGMKGSPLSLRESKAFPQLVANWAASVGNFPLAYVTLESGKKVTIMEVWKNIIISAFSKDGIYRILEDNVTLADCEELLDHCYSEIPVGTLHASELFKKLEVIQSVLEEFRSLGKPQKIEKPKFDGTEAELLELLGTGEAGPVQAVPSDSSDSSLSANDNFTDSNMSLSQRLAVRMAQVKGIKGE